MAVVLSIDLSDATFADLRALVDAAATAGVSDSVSLVLEDTTLIVSADDTSDRDPIVAPRADHPRPHFERGAHGSSVGDAAIRSVIDILTGRQDPPRGSN